MKKIALLALCLGFVAFVSAQNTGLLLNGKIKGRVPLNVPVKNVNHHSTKAVNTFHVDYDYADQQVQTATVGNYNRYIWNMNMAYRAALGDTALEYMTVGFDTLDDSYMETAMTGIRYQDLLSLTIDSIYIAGGHFNQSGSPDTLIAKIIKINTNSGYPMATVLHADTMITDTSWSGTGATSWLNSCVLGFAPNYTITTPATTHFGVKMEYRGSKLDTFGILAGFGDGGTGMCTANPSLPFFAYQTTFHPNSYRLDNAYETYGALPTSAGADTYYECDGTTGFIPGSDSDNLMQNNCIWIRITVNDQLGVANADYVNGIKLGQNIPNPANGHTTIPYLISGSSKVALDIFDMTGRLVMTLDQGDQAAGRHNIDLSTSSLTKGIYFYTLKVDNNRLTKKMIIAD